jgi:ATP:corrinoid adenosyltransferase
MNVIIIEVDKLDIILGHPWLQAVNPDIDWSTKAMRDRNTSESMVLGDEYTVPLAIHHLEEDAMARLLRQQPADIFVIGLREVRDTVDDIKTDKATD